MAPPWMTFVAGGTEIPITAFALVISIDPILVTMLMAENALEDGV